MNKQKSRRSFRFMLSISTLICWLLPIIIISSTASYLLNRNYNRYLHRAVETDVRNAMWQMEIRLNSIIEDSKAVSYDGVVRQAYRDYRKIPEKTPLYRTAADYLDQKFSRNTYYRAVYISFLDESLDILPYVSAPGTSDVALLRYYNEAVLPRATEITRQQDTGIFFTMIGSQLYMIRSLQDLDFTPYAILVMELEKTELMQSLYGLSSNQLLEVSIDGVPIPLGISETPTIDPSRTADLAYSSEVDGHTLTCSSLIIGLNIWTSVPMLRWIVVFVGSLVIPMLVIIVILFHRNINTPIATLIEANTRVRSGERGYQIHKKAPNSEFDLLYRHFNDMSCELNSQFNQLYEEQQALQQAKIRALQSQINPHFLNNTLEIINWEARLADNERVCSMIEAMSTMLDAAIGRDGRSQVLLREELNYVDAYLHITKQRLGDRLSIVKSIAPEALDCTVPLLMLQPILENAVEYDLSRTGGQLELNIFIREDRLHLEVTHDGIVSAEGWKKIRAGLGTDESSGRPDGRSVGIRNVVNRLALIYGSDFVFDIRPSGSGQILAEIVLPC